LPQEALFWQLTGTILGTVFAPSASARFLRRWTQGRTVVLDLDGDRHRRVARVALVDYDRQSGSGKIGALIAKAMSTCMVLRGDQAKVR